jgi:integrase
VESKITCNIMSNTVAPSPEERAAVPRNADLQPLSLYAPDGARKYLNRDERQRVLAAIELLEPRQALFALTLAWTGARVSEVLALTPSSFQVARGVVGTLQSGVPLNLLQRWLGHARITTTAIYAAACGPEEIQFAERFWRSRPPATGDLFHHTIVQDMDDTSTG